MVCFTGAHEEIDYSAKLKFSDDEGDEEGEEEKTESSNDTRSDNRSLCPDLRLRYC